MNEPDQIDMMSEDELRSELRNVVKQLLSAQAAIAEHNKIEVRHDTKIKVDLSALERHDAEVRAKIWREAPDQSDVQEAVIAKLDLVHRHAIEKAVAEVRKPLVDLINNMRPFLSHRCNYSLSLSGGPDTDYCTCGLSKIRERIDALAKVKE